MRADIGKRTLIQDKIIKGFFIRGMKFLQPRSCIGQSVLPGFQLPTLGKFITMNTSLRLDALAFFGFIFFANDVSLVLQNVFIIMDLFDNQLGPVRLGTCLDPGNFRQSPAPLNLA